MSGPRAGGRPRAGTPAARTGRPAGPRLSSPGRTGEHHPGADRQSRIRAAAPSAAAPPVAAPSRTGTVAPGPTVPPGEALGAPVLPTAPGPTATAAVARVPAASNDAGGPRRPAHLAPGPGRRPLVDRLASACLALAVLVALSVAIGAVAGWRVLVIRSGSMAPTLPVGGLVVTRPVPAASVHRGEIVSFHDPVLGGALVTHRVESVDVVAGQVDVVTRGDANRVSEFWHVPVDSHLGREVAVLPGFGGALTVMEGRAGRVAAIVGFAVALSAIALGWIWRRPEELDRVTG